MTHFCTSSRIENKRCSFKFYTSRIVYGHFHIPTQINDLLSYLGKKRMLQTYNFKRICEAFWFCISRINIKDQIQKYAAMVFVRSYMD